MSWFANFLSWFHPAPRPVRYPSQVGPIAPFDEMELLHHHNAERAKKGLNHLEPDGDLSDLAQARANHAASVGLQPAHLHDGFKIISGSRKSAENATMGQVDATSAMDSWMSSPGHRANILDPALSTMGAGRAISKDKITYWFTVFAG